MFENKNNSININWILTVLQGYRSLLLLLLFSCNTFDNIVSVDFKIKFIQFI